MCFRWCWWLGRCLFVCGILVPGKVGPKELDLTHQLVGGSTNGHTRAVEGPWEEGTLALHTLVTSSELDLGEGEGVTEVERTVHISVRDGSEPLGVLCSHLVGCHIYETVILSGSVDVKDMLLCPEVLRLLFELLEEITLCGVFELDRTCARVFGGGSGSGSGSSVFGWHDDGVDVGDAVARVDGSRRRSNARKGETSRRKRGKERPWTRLQGQGSEEAKSRRCDDREPDWTRRAAGKSDALEGMTEAWECLCLCVVMVVGEDGSSEEHPLAQQSATT